MSGAVVRRAILLAALLTLVPVAAGAEIRVVTTNPTLADLAHQVGGDRVRVESLMRGPENAHNVIPKPSFVVKLRKADLFVHLGLDAEPWLPSLVRSARRERLLPGGEGIVDVSSGVALLEVPSQNQLSRAMGDIHVYGNTHYALDPLNGIVIGHHLAAAFSRVDPAGAALYEEGAAELERGLRKLTESLQERMEPLRASNVVVYHRTWPYFLKRFSLKKLAEVEPKPGIAPGPRHIAGLAERMESSGVGLVIVETYSNRRIAERLAERAGGRVVVLAQEVKALPGVETYQSLFEHNVDALLAAWRDLGGNP
ncbi:MAG: zinc ABC transporter substrate-binding protein [bacterium]|nr:zinc ABC transporter substrate-binding protein [bacterium]